MMVPPTELPEQQTQNPLLAGLNKTHMLMALAQMRQEGKIDGPDASIKRPRLPSSPKR